MCLVTFHDHRLSKLNLRLTLQRNLVRKRTFWFLAFGGES
ncbi:hypothetical protein PanWU01x14_085140 [Parasponia andersonii]|uniref:Uncharacterized protein n=1 Tax=Parasponia andersonii TaxID=3476 RepID=A0A2P5D8V0_PARAD|nr:hypothetical protein PanWU01x14_085140 [Parasponia andersonii]